MVFKKSDGDVGGTVASPQSPTIKQLTAMALALVWLNVLFAKQAKAKSNGIIEKLNSRTFPLQPSFAHAALATNSQNLRRTCKIPAATLILSTVDKSLTVTQMSLQQLHCVT